jgi:hypothetical protein
MTKRSDTRATFLADVIIAAVEGGSGYWARIKDYSYGDRRGGGMYASAKFWDGADGELPTWVTVNAERVVAGLKRIKDPAFQIRSDLRALILGADVESDASNIDTEAADVIVQAGLFGQIVYG